MEKTKGQIYFEYFLLAVCLCILAIRTTYTESTNLSGSGQWLTITDDLYSISFSTTLFLAVMIWFLQTFLRKNSFYRYTAIEMGLFLFVVAGFIGISIASNKRAAINDFVTLLTPIITALLLVQLLDSKVKIKIVLVIIVALAIASAYQCATQFFVDNQLMIEQYEKEPDTILEPLGIAHGTFNHMLFEHRLYSKDVQGFFTTSNSVGSFTILAFFTSIALFLEELKNHKSNKSSLIILITGAFAVIIVLSTFIFAHSKGAIAAATIAALIFIVFLGFGNWISRHRIPILIVCTSIAIIAAVFIVSYGQKHDRLPGGNSMLVRWQYWGSALKMYSDYPLTGVGPGNFSCFYSQYKPPAALEIVKDPHNFTIAILTQYGPLGLIGFLAAIFLPLWKLFTPCINEPAKNIHKTEPDFKKLAVCLSLAIILAMLIIRPIVKPFTAHQQEPAVIIYAVITLYIMPAIVFALGLWLLTTKRTKSKINFTKITTIALFSACLGVLLHNLIDFAIFEPGVYTTFWVIIACIVALNFQQRNQKPLAIKLPAMAKLFLILIAAIIILALFNYELIPLTKNAEKIRQANQMQNQGSFHKAHNLLALAAKEDKLSPTALLIDGKLYLNQFTFSDSKQLNLLLQAEQSILQTINRNKQDYRNYEKLTDIYSLLAENTEAEQKKTWRKKAYNSALKAAELYPGLARLKVKLAELAEKLDKNDFALESYTQAVNIEDAYRKQFRIMYPGRKIFSRLGEKKYQHARKQIGKLSGEKYLMILLRRFRSCPLSRQEYQN